MTVFTAQMINIIQSIDSRRPISSGFSAPRPGAWHMEHCDPDGCPSGIVGSFWGPDSEDQWVAALSEQQKGNDYWSIHLYDSDPANLGDCYFSPDKTACASLTRVIATASDAAKKAGAGLYLGEYGGPHPNFTGPSVKNQAYPANVLDLQVSRAREMSSSFDISTIWAWMGASHRTDSVFIWPNSTIPTESGSARMLKLLLSADKALNGEPDVGRL